MRSTVANPKDIDARSVVRQWEQDWGGESGAREPRAGEIIRAIAAAGWAGWTRSYREVCPFMIERGMVNGWVSVTRPATVVHHADGKGKSGRGSVSMVNRERAARLCERYNRFHRWMTEGRHEWEFVQNIYFADNSIEVVERSKLTGETRQRMTLAPGGDACF